MLEIQPYLVRWCFRCQNKILAGLFLWLGTNKLGCICLKSTKAIIESTQRDLAVVIPIFACIFRCCLCIICLFVSHALAKRKTIETGSAVQTLREGILKTFFVFLKTDHADPQFPNISLIALLSIFSNVQEHKTILFRQLKRS